MAQLYDRSLMLSIAIYNAPCGLIVSFSHSRDVGKHHGNGGGVYHAEEQGGANYHENAESVRRLTARLVLISHDSSFFEDVVHICAKE